LPRLRHSAIILAVRELPSGTVTLLFTDIEGSTRLLHELGERYADVLAEHRRVIDEAELRVRRR
jgi:class 3 adenylate cyclase